MTHNPSRRDIVSKLPATAALAGGLGGLLAMTRSASAAGQPMGHGGPQLPEKLAKTLNATAKDGKYALPPLPYAYDALQPTIDQRTMELHHDKHHQGYVDGLNKTVEAIAKGAEGATLGGLERDLSFNYGGHALHSLFWATMGPDEQGRMGGDPRGKIADAIQKDFDGFDGFKKQWTSVAGTVKGSGWVALVFDPIAVRLHIASVGDHDRFLMPGVMPLLPLDVWEHAYYLTYQNRRGDYVKAFVDVIDWTSVNALYEMVSAPYQR